MLRYHLPLLSPRRVLDIGANVGNFYYETREAWPDASYTLVEAHPPCEPQIAATGQRYFIATIGDTRREVDFYTLPSTPTCTGNSYYREVTEHYRDAAVFVEKRTLVSLSELLPGETFDFIKLDVQGAERDVIMGGSEIFRAAEHVLMEVSVQEYNKGAPLWLEMLPFMASIGFVEYVIVADIHHPEMGLIQHDVLSNKSKT